MTGYFSNMEREAMEMMIAAEPDSNAEAFREQLNEIVGVKTNATGVGFFKEIELSSKAKPLPGKTSFVLQGVHADVGNREESCVMFVFFVVDGFLRTLESVTTEDKWPEKLEPYKLAYTPRVG